jgi:adenine-specific DNA-methyltransferase
LPPIGRHWRFSQEKFQQALLEKRVVFGKNGKGRPQYKRFKSEAEGRGTNPFTVWTDTGTATEGTKELMRLFDGKKLFDTPKPVRLINEVLKLSVDNNSIILDFFAGSGTTAHAVMELNAEDGGNRQCISVQMPEKLDEASEAYKAGYRTIADITRARVDKVIAKLKAENQLTTQDLACAHFTLAPSNFKVWRGDVTTAEALREQLSIFQTAEKQPTSASENTQTAMLTELLLKHGLGALGVHAISKPRQVAGVTVHRVLMADNKTMWLCFETYSHALKDEIIKAMPAQVIMLNSCFVCTHADEQLANLQLELAGLDIGLMVI